MPIYEYQCGACGARTEILQRLDEAPLAHCPHCGGPMSKLVSAPAFQFKGSGWYVTDYAGKGKAGAAGSSRGAGGSASEAAKGEPAGESKSESKSEAKSEPKAAAKADGD
ncbi:MAG: zinc ribbon domain-containing protein [Thermoanaerobaculia bacterium]|nr:zinc ribbon domain-containing protein [Thermoanaerobaculia bacterium]